MASSYALPASSMTHSHHSHGHAHSHSHSPARPSANTPRAIKQERSNEGLHPYPVPDSNLGNISEHSHTHAREHSPPPVSDSPYEYVHEPTYSHGREREPSPSPYRSSSHYETINIESPIVDDPFGMTDDMPVHPTSYQPPVNGHHHEPHKAIAPAGPRSRFTNFLIPLVSRWPLIHTILAEKDSRRIFYFMRYFLLLSR